MTEPAPPRSGMPAGIDAIYAEVRRLAGAADGPLPPAPPEVTQVAPGIVSVAVRTPTLPPATHTGCFVAGVDEVVAIDPGSPYPDQQEALAREIGGRGALVAVILTHHHGDHAGGASALARALGAPVWAHAATAAALSGVEVARHLEHGEVLAVGGRRLRVLHTPGHAAGHVCLRDEASAATVAGDMVAGVGTILIDPAGGHMATYLASLEAMLAAGVGALLPAHGPVIDDGPAKLREYLAQWRGGDPDWRIFAGFSNPNQAAAVLVVLLPVAAAALVLLDDRSAPARWLAGQGVAQGSLKLRLAAGLAFVLMLLALGLTRSRGGLLAVGCGGAALAVGLVRAGRPRTAAGLLAAGAVLAVLLVLGPLRSRLALGLAHSNSFRVLTWLGTWDLARHHPLLGCGLGGWPVAYPFYARAGFTQHAHNEYLQTLAETGVIGLAALLALIAAWLATAWRRAGTSETRAMGLALLAATVGFAVHAALDHGWHVTAVPVALALLHGAARVREPAPRPRAWPAALVVILLLALWSTERHRAEAARALRDGYPSTAREALRAAVRTTPFSALAWEDLAGVEAGRGDLDAAQTAYREALRRRPTSARLYYRLAQALLEAGRPLEAQDESQRGVALSPLHLQGYLQLGSILERLDRPSEARDVYQRLDELAQRPELSEDNPLQGYVFEPTHAYGLMRLAELCLAAGDDRIAREAFTRALDQFEAYLKTYDDALASMKELDQADQLELLALRGLHPAERQEVEALVRRARQKLGTPPNGIDRSGPAPPAPPPPT